MYRPSIERIPIGEPRSVQPDRADGWLDRADQHLAERRLARSVRPDDADNLTGLGAKTDPHEDRPAVRSTNADAFNLDLPLRRREGRVNALPTRLLENVGEPMDGGPRRGERGSSRR